MPLTLTVKKTTSALGQFRRDAAEKNVPTTLGLKDRGVYAVWHVLQEVKQEVSTVENRRRNPTRVRQTATVKQSVQSWSYRGTVILIVSMCLVDGEIVV